MSLRFIKKRSGGCVLQQKFVGARMTDGAITKLVEWRDVPLVTEEGATSERAATPPNINETDAFTFLAGSGALPEAPVGSNAPSVERIIGLTYDHLRRYVETFVRPWLALSSLEQGAIIAGVENSLREKP